jgi:hypothetical protein
MNRKFIYVLLIYLCFFVMGLAFHHHEDGVTHDNCPICSYISHHSNFSFQDTPQISPPTYDILLIFLENTVNLSCICCSPYSNRAPPA